MPALRFASTRLAAIALVPSVSAGIGTAASPATREATAGGDPAESYVGAAVCGRCHAEIEASWHEGRHSKMVRPIAEDNVVGDFTQGELKLHGQSFSVARRGDEFFVSGRFLDSQPREHRIDYTLGSRRIQHYLTTLDNGEILVLPTTWDVLRGEWFHNLEIVRPDEIAQDKVQVWNKVCAGCHVSPAAKNYDPRSHSYATTWIDNGTGCERCHGPGREHAAHYEKNDHLPGEKVHAIESPARLSAEKSTMVCAQCHSLRDVVADGFTAGADYYDYFLPLLEYAMYNPKDPAYWPDGRPRRFSNDTLGLWQSECFRVGAATCVACHGSAHAPDVDAARALHPRNNGLCTSCHEEIKTRLTQHTKHSPASPGSSCVECHMPKTVVSIKASMRDHTIGVPTPENTVKHGIPNACNECHEDRSPEWAVESLTRWSETEQRRKLVERADTFAAARARSPAAIDALVEMAASAEGPITRANAVGYLARFAGDRRAAEAVARSLSDTEPLVRGIAALKLGGMGEPGAQHRAELIEGLDDSHRVVRTGAAFSLVNLGVKRLPGDAGVLFERAKADYIERGRLLADDAAAQAELGKFHLKDGDFERAALALRHSARLDPARDLRYFIAVADAGRGRTSEAQRALEAIPEGDPFYSAARRLLATLERP